MNDWKRSVKLALIWLGIYGLAVLVGYLISVPGSDWVHHWAPRYSLDMYVPWVRVILFFLPELPFLTGLTLTALGLSLWARKASLVHYLAAFTAMPLFWTIWLGQIDAIPLIGLVILPWGIPLVLLKPQVAIWYVWSWWKRRPDRWLIAGGSVLFVLLTFLIWGLWPLRFVTPAAYRTVYDLSTWRFSWILGAIFLIAALLESDPDRAMALGALGVPYLQGSSYVALLPSLVRLSGWRLLVAWGATWLSVLAVFLGDIVRPLAMLFPLLLWALLRMRGSEAATRPAMEEA